MINKNGKRVNYSNDAKKKKKDDITLELAKHAGKSLKDLTVKQKDDLLIVLGAAETNGKIK